MAVEEETPNRAGEKAWLERILGVSKGHYVAVLPVRLERGPFRRSGPETSDNCRRSDHAANSGTSETRLHLLPEHSLR